MTPGSFAKSNPFFEGFDIVLQKIEEKSIETKEVIPIHTSSNIIGTVTKNKEILKSILNKEIQQSKRNLVQLQMSYRAAEDKEMVTTPKLTEWRQYIDTEQSRLQGLVKKLNNLSNDDLDF